MLQDQSRNRTPMPGAQAPGAAPPDAGPARAEAGIATMLSESPFTLPVQMPAPGSPEAMALHKAACTEFDRRTHLTNADYARLRIGDTHTLWTTRTVRKVLEDDYSSLTGAEAYAANEKTPAELQELLVLTMRREQQFAEAQRDLKLHAVHALAFPDDQEEVEADQGEDPIFAVIREHKAAYAAWLPHLRATSEAPMGTPSYHAAEAAAEAPCDREQEAYEALSEVLPTTLDGLDALASYLPGAVLRNSCTNADSDAMHALGAMCGAVKELVKSGASGGDGRPDLDTELIEIGQQWPGLVKAYLSADSRVHDVEELDEEPQRPKELNVYSFDNLNGFPRTEDWGNRFAPYDADQIDELRAVPRVAVYLATPRGGIRREDGTFLNINEAAQRRAESIIEAWDRWQAEIAAYEAKHDLPALRASCWEATAAYDAAILKARSLPAQTVAGLLVKARIAAELCPFGFKEDDDALDENAILKSVLADLLKIGQPSATTLRAAETDPAAIAAGRTAVVA